MRRPPMTKRLILERLNELAKADPIAMQALCSQRVFCNEQLQALAPTVEFKLGLLGVLNHLFGPDLVLVGSAENPRFEYTTRKPTRKRARKKPRSNLLRWPEWAKWNAG